MKNLAYILTLITMLVGANAFAGHQGTAVQRAFNSHRTAASCKVALATAINSCDLVAESSMGDLDSTFVDAHQTDCRAKYLDNCENWNDCMDAGKDLSQCNHKFEGPF